MTDPHILFVVLIGTVIGLGVISVLVKIMIGLAPT
jgi:hypothetical protein